MVFRSYYYVIWCSEDAYLAWYDNGDTAYVGVVFEVYNIQGRLINQVIKSDIEPGYHTYIWDGTNHSSGIYLIRIKISDTVKHYRTIMIK